MLSLSECRKILGKKYENCTDQQIRELLNWLYQLAEYETGEITTNQTNTIHMSERKAG